jgi:hypothetical protein
VMVTESGLQYKVLELHRPKTTKCGYTTRVCCSTAPCSTTPTTAASRRYFRLAR